MRTFLVLIFTLSVGSVHAQSNPKPLTDEEIMYTDKLNGTLATWTKKQRKAFVADCESRIKGIIDNSKNFCKCAMKSMKTGINYERYYKSSDYQKGLLTTMHGKLDCEAIIKKK